jgi:Rap1a immunity proteins
MDLGKATIVAAVLIFAGWGYAHENRKHNLDAMAQEPSWTKKRYHVLQNGNQLHSDCRSLQEHFKMDEGVTRTSDASQFEIFNAGVCWGYIEAVVESIPEGEGFEPSSSVRMSQHVDVVLAYLRDNPASRDQSAYYLVRTALSTAFAKRQ